MVNTQKPTCSTCYNFDLSRYICRLNPPNVVKEVNNITGNFEHLSNISLSLNPYNEFVYPTVSPEDWCGQHSDLHIVQAS